MNNRELLQMAWHTALSVPVEEKLRKKIKKLKKKNKKLKRKIKAIEKAVQYAEVA